MNHITLTGAVATEPRRRSGLDQPAVAFRLAVARDGDGSEPLKVDVVCVEQLAGFACRLEPGDHLGVAGRLDHHEWVGDEGMRRARWVVVAREGDRPTPERPGGLTSVKVPSCRTPGGCLPPGAQPAPTRDWP